VALAEQETRVARSRVERETRIRTVGELGGGAVGVARHQEERRGEDEQRDEDEQDDEESEAAAASGSASLNARPHSTVP
jgi:hypothetical protein